MNEKSIKRSNGKNENVKRTQIRIPKPEYDAILECSNENNISSLNSAMLELMKKGLNAENNVDINGKIQHLKVAEK